MNKIFQELEKFPKRIRKIEELINNEISLYPSYNLIIDCKLTLIPFYSKNKIGFLNKEVDVVIKPIYEQIQDEFRNDCPLVRVKIKNKWGLINVKGEYILKPEYNRISDYEANVYIINANYKYAVCDSSGNIIVDFGEYDFIYPPFNYLGLAKVKKNKKWGIINKEGNLVLPIKYDNIWNFQGKFREDTIVEKDGIKKTILFKDLLIKEKMSVEDEDFVDDYEYSNNYDENDNESAYDNPYYNDNLDFDQQDQEFWNQY